MLHFDISHPIVKRGSRVSRAPPHPTLPAFLNLNGTIINLYDTMNRKIHYDSKIHHESKNSS